MTKYLRSIFAAIVAAGMLTLVAAAPTTAAATDSDDQIVEAVAKLDATYHSPVVTRTLDSVNVRFSDYRGRSYDYTFSTPVSDGDATTNYATRWNRWELNKRETRELAEEGAQASVIYIIAVAAGCKACVVGAAIEGHWAARAAAYSSRNHCAKIYFWLTISEYSGGNCR